MSALKNKTILLISPQEWGKMLLSKHHYAVELAKRGNRVYFLNPPDQKAELPRNTVIIEESKDQPNLFLINHRLYFPFWLKFKAFPVFHLLIRKHIRHILKKIGTNLDIVWSFDIGNLYPFPFFPAQSLKIFHPVDEPLLAEAIRAAKGSDIVFSVTHEILAKYNQFNIPRHFIHHGVKEEFIANFSNGTYMPGTPLKIGYSGNMLRGDIDRVTLLRTIRENPEMEFHFFGSYEAKHTNIGGDEDEAAKEFVRSLKGFSSVKLHGVLSQQQLATMFKSMDAFFVCYDIERDQSHGTNYHKLMEYLATGRVIISNNISTYADQPSLIQMTAERNNNDKLPELFGRIMHGIGEHNSAELIAGRMKFAASNTYGHQIARIEKIIESLPAR